MEHAVGIAFPGQGGNWAATVRRLQDRPDHPLVRALREKLGAEPEDLDGLDTRHAQPAVYVAGLVGDPIEADLAVGHSMGEITAAAWTGAIEEPTGLDLLLARADLGHRAHTERPGAMAAVNRWDRNRVEELRREVQNERGGVLDLAVVNSETQIVLSGDRFAIEFAVELANERGAVARRLPIGGAYHSRLLREAIPEFRAAVRAAVTADPRVPIVSCTTATIVDDGEQLVESLVGGLVGTVDWPATLSTLLGRGVATLIDAGPGDTLLRLGRHLDGPSTVRR